MDPRTDTMKGTQQTPRAHDTRSSDEIRRDIERNRQRLDQTSDELGDRLSPGKVLDDLWSSMRNSSGGNSLSALGDAVREHPVPVALVTAGLGWLLVESVSGHSASIDRSGGRDGGERSYDSGFEAGTGARGTAYGSPGTGSIGSGEDDGGDGSSLGSRLSDAASTAGDKSSELAGRAGSALSGARDRAGDAASDAAEAASRWRGEAGRRGRHAADRAGQGFWHLLDSNPLAVGAAALGLGVISGLSVPTTRAEDELMGEASSRLAEGVREAGSEAVEKGKRVAGEAAGAARREADAQTPDAASVKERVQRVASEATGAAKRAAEDEGLTREAARDKAAEVGGRVRDAAPDAVKPSAEKESGGSPRADRAPELAGVGNTDRFGGDRGPGGSNR